MASTLAQLGFDIRTNEIKDATKSLDKLSAASKGVDKSQRGLAIAAKLAAGALGALGAAQVIRSIFDTVRSTEALQASLKTVTGSIQSATEAWDELLGFAKTTPFTLDQSVNGFIKMKALGLDPTTEAMKAFGNTSAAMGKSLTQMIEAVADASTGEFERLKEFGIKSKREGDNVIFTFQGVETTIKNSSDSIVGYLEDIGNTQFVGAMADQMNTINGQLSNLEDNVDGLFRAIGAAGVADSFSSSIETASSAVDSLTENLDGIIDAATFLSIAVGVRLTKSLSLSASAMVVSSIAAGRSAAADAVAAQQAVRRTAAELLTSKAILSRAVADSKALAGTNAHAFAMANLSAASTRSTAAHLANTAAVSASTAAMAKASISARALGVSMAFVGGPLGVVVTAAAALLYFGTTSDSTAQDAVKLQARIDDLGDSFDKLGKKQAAVAVLDLAESNKKLNQELSIANARAETLNMNISRFGQGSKAAEWREELIRVEGTQEKLGGQIATTSGKIEKLNSIINNTDASELGEAAKTVTSEFAKLSESIDQQYLKLKLGENGYLQYKLAIAGATEAQIASILEIKNASGAIVKDASTKKEATESAKEYSDALKVIAQNARDAINPLSDLNKSIKDAISANAAGLLDDADLKNYLIKLNKDFKSAGDKSGSGFAKSFESSTSSIASSLQDAITSGDWAGLGATIGGALAGGIAASVSDSMATSLGTIGAGFAGAVAGGLAGLAVQKITEFMTDDYDPTARRQASQGTGTVLGSINEKSRSIEKSSDITASATSELIGINRSMLNALERVNSGITNASASVARGSNINFSSPGITNGVSGSREFDDLISMSTLGLGIGGEIGKIFGGSSKKKDEGIQIVGGYMSDLIDDTLVNAYATFRVKKNFYSKTKTKNKTQDLGDEIGNQFSLVFESVLDSVIAGASAFGIDSSATDGFKIKTQKISTEKMSAEDEEKAYQEYFGTVFDNLTAYTIPWLEDFQQAGEGMGETFSRVGAQIQTTNDVVRQLGVGFQDLNGADLAAASQYLVEAAGGMEQLGSSMTGFIKNFESETRQFETQQESLTMALSQSGLPLADTRAGYLALMKQQDGSTQAGADNIATLLRLQSHANDYYNTLEEGAESASAAASAAATEMLNSQKTMQSAALSQSMSAANAVNNALSGLSTASASQSRMSALDSISSMTSNGSVGSVSDLQGTLSAATNINASDFATFDEYIRTVSRTGAALVGLKQVTDSQVTKDQQLLTNIENEIKVMSSELIKLSEANVKQSAKSARILERIEVGGIEVKA